MNIEDKLSDCSVFIKYVMNTQVQIFRQDAAADKLIEPLLFSPVQMFDTDFRFLEFVRQMGEKTIYVVTDRLSLVWLFVCTQGWITMAGPCRTHDLASSVSSQRMRQLGIHESDRRALDLYRKTFSPVEENDLLQAAYAIVQIVYGSTEDAPVVHTLLELGAENPAAVVERHQQQPIASVEHTYDLESRFIEAVAQGNTAEALLLIRQLSMRTRNAVRLSSAEQSIRASIAGIAIVRTLSRTAARQAGVPAPAIDALTGEFARRAQTSATAEEIDAQYPELVERICALVRQYRLRPYSPLVRKVIHYVLLNLRNDLAVEKIAGEISVSPNYLSAVFHKEVGKTLLSYIQKMRLEKAANLLAYTTAPVQAICVEVGIPDNNYFAKLFKKEYGLTPSAYRAKPENQIPKRN